MAASISHDFHVDAALAKCKPRRDQTRKIQLVQDDFVARTPVQGLSMATVYQMRQH